MGFALLALNSTLRADDNSESKSGYSSSSEKEDSSKNSEDSSKNSEGSDSSKKAVVADPVYSPVQSAARPFNLSIADKVEVGGSDAASKKFQSEVLPEMLKTIVEKLPEAKAVSAKTLKSIAFDPKSLVLGQDSNVRVYFVSEGAGYSNTLGISSTNGGPLDKGAELVFPNVSSPQGYGGSGKAVRSSNEPLLAGDFVDVGTFKAGSALDFFLIANGAFGGRDTFSTNSSLNPDGLIHAVSFSSEGSPYLLVSFEDLYGGGDKDYNDVVFAVSITKAGKSLGAPEPTLAAGSLVAGLAFLGFGRRRRTV